jgi:hypothetical protein
MTPTTGEAIGFNTRRAVGAEMRDKRMGGAIATAFNAVGAPRARGLDPLVRLLGAVRLGEELSACKPPRLAELAGLAG